VFPAARCCPAGGRGFGTFVSWFMLGGDLYTAYTFIAVPARTWRRPTPRRASQTAASSVIRRNMALLPAYSLVLGLVALLGYMALAAPGVPGVPGAVKADGANASIGGRWLSAGPPR
jgi:hypothetical protein